MTVEISDLKHLQKVVKSLRGVEGVVDVERASRLAVGPPFRAIRPLSPPYLIAGSACRREGAGYRR